MPTLPSGKVPSRGSPFEGNFVGRAEITVGAENTSTNTAVVAVQLYTGPNLLYLPGVVTAYLSDNADGSTLAATAPDGGWAISTDGLLIPMVTNKAAMFVSETDGTIDVAIIESTAKTFYMVVNLPDGSQEISGAITFA